MPAVTPRKQKTSIGDETSITTQPEPEQPTIDVGGPELPPAETPAPLTLEQRLIAAQKEIGNVTKNARNPHFKNKFVDVTQLLSAVLPALHNHGLFLSQRVELVYTGTDSQPMAVLVTQIFDEEGNPSAPSQYPIISKDDTDPQKFGAGVTYARRYALMAYLGIGTEDDDGNTAAKPKSLLSPEHTALRDHLLKMGATKETVPLLIDKRFGTGVYKSFTAIPVAEAKKWNEELTQENVPF